MEEARKADIELDAAAANTDSNIEVGWLLGIPLAIKDLEDVKGLPTTKGSPLRSIEKSEGEDGEESYGYFGNLIIYKNEIEDEPFVGRLRDAGAIIIGKTNVPELGMGCHSYNNIHGTTRNPKDLSLSAGGSSGGAAAAVASHMLSICDGSDMMGSLRNPAGWNKLYSLRPTAGMTEEEGDESNILPYPISTVGPIARDPLDLAMYLQTILPERQQTHFEASEVINSSMSDLDTLVESSKIGWLGDWGGSLPYEDGVLSHCKRSLDLFPSKGDANIVCISTAPFPSDQLWNAWMTIRSSHIWRTLKEQIGCDESELISTLKARGVKREAVWECELGITKTLQDLEHAKQIVEDWALCSDELFNTYDFLALPSSQVYPFDAGIDWPKTIGNKKMNEYHRWMEVMCPVTLLGAPCVTLPAAVDITSEQMIGIQVFAQAGKDASLLSLARWYHENQRCVY